VWKSFDVRLCLAWLSLCSWELLEMGASDVSLLGAEGRDGDRRGKKTHCIFFFFVSGVKKRISRKIASNALGRTVWSQHLLGQLLTCYK